MKSSNIGGQAVLEGIMMKNGDRYAVGVRRPDQEIEVRVQEHKSFVPRAVRKIPFIRGIFNFIDSLVLGMKALMFSAEFIEDEEGEARELTADEAAKEEKKESLVMSLVLVLSIVLAIGIFMVLPYFLSGLLKRVITSRGVLTVLEGLIRVMIFLGYITLVSRMKDIQRTFMYHGAEHKCINCIEHGLDLNVENVRISSRQHKRCGTSFLFMVIAISIIVSTIVFAIWPVYNPFFCFFSHLAMLPLIVGISYEINRWAGRHDGPVTRIFTAPGLWLQNFTTFEPDDSMIEVGIKALTLVLPEKKGADAW